MKRTAILLSLVIFFSWNQLAAQRPGLVIHDYNKNSNGKQQPKYTMAQFEGRWQETARMNAKTKAMADFSDTLYILFYNNGKADTKQGNSVVITGTTELFRDDYITTSANDFKILSVAPDEIMLDDLTGSLRKLARTRQFAYEVITAPPVAIVDTTKDIIDLTPASLLKNWFAYRRSAAPGFLKPETPLIRKLKITEKLNDNNYKAEIEFGQSGQAYVQPCTLSFNENNITIVTENNNWNLEIYKSDGQEMIMGKKGELVYYFKNSGDGLPPPPPR